MKIGDKVILKSGGPVMTVIEMESEKEMERHAYAADGRRISVAWFNYLAPGHQAVERYTFPEGALELETAQMTPQKPAEEDWSKAS